jgi:hypothetical protein
MDFERALPRLVQLYERGLLVPFLGAGMSAGTCESWMRLLEKLERKAGISIGAGTMTDPAEIIQRAHSVVRRLRSLGGDRYLKELRRGLGYKRRVAPPVQTRALATIWWPLVLTTNYDNCFVAAYSKKYVGLRVRGRSPRDCQRVLTSLTAPAMPILWALQGYLATPCKPRPSDEEHRKKLASQVVFGHAEYREVTHKEVHFRRAFTEVFRSRSLFFLGAGLRDPYLLDLFGEVLEHLGPNPNPHYALVKKGEANEDFLRSRLNTIVIPYDRFEDLPLRLKAMASAIDGSRTRQVSWGVSSTARRRVTRDPETDFEIIRGKLPLPSAHEAAAISVGRGPSGVARLGSQGAYLTEALRAKLLTSDAVPAIGNRIIRRIGHSSFFLIAARTSKTDERDVRLVRTAAYELFSRVSAAGFERLMMPLVAAGPSGHFPPRFALIQTICALRDWRKKNAEPLSVSIHVVDPNVIHTLTANKIDIGELLSCGDVRFWVQVVGDSGIVERTIQILPGTTRLRELLDSMGLPKRGFLVDVTPAPTNEYRAEPVQSVLGRTLDALGVVPGATVQLLTSGSSLKPARHPPV